MTNSKYESLIEKLSNLTNCIKKLSSILISYSGGIDSSLLAFIVFKIVQHKNSTCLLINTNLISSRNINNAIEFLKYYNLKFKIIKFNFISIKSIKRNNKDRCFFCKSKMISLLSELSEKNEYKTIIDGTNASDKNNMIFRPGIKAISKSKDSFIKIQSPFLDFNFTKEDIYKLSKLFGLKKQHTDSCLATRLQYGLPITKKILNIIEKSELMLLSLGLTPVRVRLHLDSKGYLIARIEILLTQLDIYIKHEKLIREQFNEVKNLDFITIDIYGFRSGSFDL